MNYINKNNIAYLTWLIALFAMVGSLYFQYAMGFPPCEFCWYQRIAIYPLTLIIPVGILRKDLSLHKYVLPFSITGLALSVYHNLLYYGVIPEQLAPCTNGVSCATKFINLFGFVDIPLLSLIALVSVNILMIIYSRSKN